MSASRRQATVRPALDIVTARVLTPAWLLFLLGLQITNGTTDALPVWLRNLALQAGTDPETVLRGLMVGEIVFAGVMLVIPQVARGVAFATLLTLCFSAIASISADPGDRHAVALHAIILVVAALLLLGLRRRDPRPTLPAPPMTLSPQWRVVAMLGVITVAGAVGARVDIRTPLRPEPGAELQIVRFDLDSWLGMPVAQIELREHLPMLTPRTMEGERIVVFYTATCGSCHDLFERRFAGRLDVPVIAVMVPPPPNVEAAPGDPPREIDCPECELMRLRPGPLYLIQTPVVLVVRDGIIRCVADSRDPERCLRAEP